MANFVKKTYRYTRGKLWDYYGYKDAQFLVREYPLLKDFSALHASKLAEVRSLYDTYVQNVSTVGHAISWQAVEFLMTIAYSIEPQKILDLGSGFSSYVLRKYAASTQQRIIVYSVDDNAQWLEKTFRFLAENGLSTDNLMLWPDFVASEQSDFDLIFHDLGRMEMREQTLPLVLSLRSETGIVILDDMHKKPYRLVATKEVERMNLSLYSARKFTLDQYGRFSKIVIY